jgi:group II intron reverse transcriptase/maturase
MTQSFNISKQVVVNAYKAVKANAGAAGVDRQTISEFENNLKNNLYKLWNRMSSGSYVPPPVKAVEIPKASGGVRILGIPTVTDRIAQMIVKHELEPEIEPHFLTDSYGYRPNKSALDAIGVTRERCWKYDWVLEFDIKGLFDHLPHELLMKAVRHHTKCRWVILYIERWIKASIQYEDGRVEARNCGVPQGGVISPLLSNLFLHYAFDAWMKRNHPNIPWCRYADDGLAHCRTYRDAERLLTALESRFKECGLALHPNKTRIVCCNVRNRDYAIKSFDYLGYTFRPRPVKNRREQRVFVGFTPGVSKDAVQKMKRETKRQKWHLRSDLSLEQISQQFNPMLKGWTTYYGKYSSQALSPIAKHVNMKLIKWARRKYKHLKRHKIRAIKYIQRIADNNVKMFATWELQNGYVIV